MSRSSFFFKKVSGQRAATSFKGATIVTFFHGYVLLDAYCYHFFAFFLHSQLFRGGSIVPWLHPCRTLAKIRGRFTEKSLFLKIYDFGIKNQQNRGRFKNYVLGTKN